MIQTKPSGPRRLLGLGLVIVSAVGLVLSLVGLVFVARASRGIAANTQDALEVIASTLETTSEMLALIDKTLGETADAVGTARTTTLDIRQTLQATDAMLTSLTGMLGSDLPEVVTSTQASLESAQASAQVIDGVLLGLNAIAPLTGVSYNPDQPLAESLAEVETSLDSLPGTFTEIAKDVSAAQDDLGVVEDDLNALADDLADIEASLKEAQEVITDYRAQVDDLTARVSDLQERVPRWVRAATLGAIFVLVWLALSQIGLLFQGWEMVSVDHRRLAAKVEELDEIVRELQGKGGKGKKE